MADLYNQGELDLTLAAVTDHHGTERAGTVKTAVAVEFLQEAVDLDAGAHSQVLQRTLPRDDPAAAAAALHAHPQLDPFVPGRCALPAAPNTATLGAPLDRPHSLSAAPHIQPQLAVAFAAVLGHRRRAGGRNRRRRQQGGVAPAEVSRVGR